MISYSSNFYLEDPYLKHHVMKTYWRSGGIAPRILNLGSRWGGKLNALAALPPEEWNHGTHWNVLYLFIYLVWSQTIVRVC